MSSSIYQLPPARQQSQQPPPAYSPPPAAATASGTGKDNDAGSEQTSTTFERMTMRVVLVLGLFGLIAGVYALAINDNAEEAQAFFAGAGVVVLLIALGMAGYVEFAVRRHPTFEPLHDFYIGVSLLLALGGAWLIAVGSAPTEPAEISLAAWLMGLWTIGIVAGAAVYARVRLAKHATFAGAAVAGGPLTWLFVTFIPFLQAYVVFAAYYRGEDTLPDFWVHLHLLFITGVVMASISNRAVMMYVAAGMTALPNLLFTLITGAGEAASAVVLLILYVALLGLVRRVDPQILRRLQTLVVGLAMLYVLLGSTTDWSFLGLTVKHGLGTVVHFALLLSIYPVAMFRNTSPLLPIFLGIANAFVLPQFGWVVFPAFGIITVVPWIGLLGSTHVPSKGHQSLGLSAATIGAIIFNVKVPGDELPFDHTIPAILFTSIMAAVVDMNILRNQRSGEEIAREKLQITRAQQAPEGDVFVDVAGAVTLFPSGKRLRVHTEYGNEAVLEARSLVTHPPTESQDNNEWAVVPINMFGFAALTKGREYRIINVLPSFDQATGTVARRGVPFPTLTLLIVVSLLSFSPNVIKSATYARAVFAAAAATLGIHTILAWISQRHASTPSARNLSVVTHFVLTTLMMVNVVGNFFSLPQPEVDRLIFTWLLLLLAWLCCLAPTASVGSWSELIRGIPVTPARPANRMTRPAVFTVMLGLGLSLSFINTWDDTAPVLPLALLIPSIMLAGEYAMNYRRVAADAARSNAIGRALVVLGVFFYLPSCLHIAFQVDNLGAIRFVFDTSLFLGPMLLLLVHHLWYRIPLRFKPSPSTTDDDRPKSLEVTSYIVLFAMSLAGSFIAWPLLAYALVRSTSMRASLPATIVRFIIPFVIFFKSLAFSGIDEPDEVTVGISFWHAVMIIIWTASFTNPFGLYPLLWFCVSNLMVSGWAAFAMLAFDAIWIIVCMIFGSPSFFVVLPVFANLLLLNSQIAGAGYAGIVAAALALPLLLLVSSPPAWWQAGRRQKQQMPMASPPLAYQLWWSRTRTWSRVASTSTAVFQKQVDEMRCKLQAHHDVLSVMPPQPPSQQVKQQQVDKFLKHVAQRTNALIKAVEEARPSDPTTDAASSWMARTAASVKAAFAPSRPTQQQQSSQQSAQLSAQLSSPTQGNVEDVEAGVATLPEATADGVTSDAAWAAMAVLHTRAWRIGMILWSELALSLMLVSFSPLTSDAPGVLAAAVVAAIMLFAVSTSVSGHPQSVMTVLPAWMFFFVASVRIDAEWTPQLASFLVSAIIVTHDAVLLRTGRIPSRPRGYPQLLALRAPFPPALTRRQYIKAVPNTDMGFNPIDPLLQVLIFALYCVMLVYVPLQRKEEYLRALGAVSFVVAMFVAAVVSSWHLMVFGAPWLIWLCVPLGVTSRLPFFSYNVSYLTAAGMAGVVQLAAVLLQLVLWRRRARKNPSFLADAGDVRAPTDASKITLSIVMRHKLPQPLPLYYLALPIIVAWAFADATNFIAPLIVTAIVAVLVIPFPAFHVWYVLYPVLVYIAATLAAERFSPGAAGIGVVIGDVLLLPFALWLRRGATMRRASMRIDLSDWMFLWLLLASLIGGLAVHGCHRLDVCEWHQYVPGLAAAAVAPFWFLFARWSTALFLFPLMWGLVATILTPHVNVGFGAGAAAGGIFLIIVTVLVSQKSDRAFGRRRLRRLMVNEGVWQPAQQEDMDALMQSPVRFWNRRGNMLRMLIALLRAGPARDDFARYRTILESAAVFWMLIGSFAAFYIGLGSLAVVFCVIMLLTGAVEAILGFQTKANNRRAIGLFMVSVSILFGAGIAFDEQVGFLAPVFLLVGALMTLATYSLWYYQNKDARQKAAEERRRQAVGQRLPEDNAASANLAALTPAGTSLLAAAAADTPLTAEAVAMIPSLSLLEQLIDAIQAGDARKVLAMLRQRDGVDFNAKTIYQGATPLALAASQPGDRSDIVRLLLSAGADTTIADDLGRVPYDIAVFAGNTQCAHVLSSGSAIVPAATSVAATATATATPQQEDKAELPAPLAQSEALPLFAATTAAADDSAADKQDLPLFAGAAAASVSTGSSRSRSRRRRSSAAGASPAREYTDATAVKVSFTGSSVLVPGSANALALPVPRDVLQRISGAAGEGRRVVVHQRDVDALKAAMDKFVRHLVVVDQSNSVVSSQP